ncbi:hypothetical protein [Bacteroides fragilis]|uniref:Uncharacterized protein n=1 Tax=Bacteroides fragilis TaxID=817 RepID=A0ABD4VQ32_BACFG|nr:hypothetical protein [Bacteroides fragilis]MCZ2653488.1 hypothetical protein [Bacteroides fragilis]
MTTKKYADFIEKQTRSVDNVSTEPIFGEYIIRVSGKKIGVLYQSQCYLLLTDKGKELLPNAITCRPYRNSPGEKDFILVEDTENKDLLCALFEVTYKELYAQQELMDDFSYIFTVNRNYMEHIERLYDDIAVLLSYCWENGFLRERPVDTKGRIIKLEFRRKDLTPDGEIFYVPFVEKFIAYTDRTQKTPSDKLINKWLDEVKAK